MSGTQMQPAGREVAMQPYDDTDNLPAAWGGGNDVAPAPAGPKLGRYLSALNRFKWLIVLFGVLGAAGGYTATKFIPSEYEVNSRVVLEQATGTSTDGRDRGPIRAPELLGAAGWRGLLRSFRVVDWVVSDLALFVTPSVARDSVLFRGFRADEQRPFFPGEYLLKVNGQRYSLGLKAGVEVEAGAVGDSIGRTRGFLWQPAQQELAGRKEVEFTVQTPRETSRELTARMQDNLQAGSPYMELTLTGEEPVRTAAILNEWMDRFVTVATALKKKNVTDYAVILEGQLDFTAKQLAAAEDALNRYRTAIVTLPNDRQKIAPGIGLTTNPAIESYMMDKTQAEAIQEDRQTLERVFQGGRASGTIPREAVLSVPSVTTDPAAENLRKILAEQTEREVTVRKLRETATDEAQQVQTAMKDLDNFKRQIVPAAMETYLQQLSIRERQLKANIDVSTRELRGIPARAIEEARLERKVGIAAEMYTNLDLKTQEAKLAEAATIADISILDKAVPPLRPTRNTAPVIILGAVAAALGLGIALAILIDQTDKRFRYPEQATDDLGLFILGVVPNVDNKARRRAADQAAQVVESFRTIRMNVRYAADPARPLMMTITSPGPNDGKSLIASNLALSFAEAGSRTLLVDGDIRRGELAKTFAVSQKPGLVEYLDGTALISEVLHPATSHPNLTVMPAGARRRRAPELLATPRLNQLLNQMSAEYDVVVVDSPPLGAGFDAYALSTATGNMALVLRVGVTDRKMAQAKMAVVDTLPVRVMGAILNGITLTGVYQYYSYYQDYAAQDEETDVRMVSGGRSNLPATVSAD
ncbi:MAG: polysaccharide biosynthesis tyrosine autokinase [Gemmatimonadota bacterium]